MRILVTGAAGKTGRAIMQALAREAVSIRALVRREEQIEQAKSVGAVEVNVGDMLDTAVWRQATHLSLQN